MGRVTAYARREAMGTFFEAFLAGDDAGHLAAVAEAALDEVTRLHHLLSRFDPASEVSRLNREAPGRPVRADPELWAILCRCQEWCGRTGGCFDVTAAPGLPTRDALRLDEQRRTVQLAAPGVRIDLGGFGKGYALDQAGAVVRAFGVPSALLHGGTSSVLAVGRRPDGSPWPIDVRDPFDPGGAPVGRVALADGGLSCSATRAPGQTVSDVIDPACGEPLSGLAACVVLAPEAAETEALSTALLAMGKRRAAEYLDRTAGAGRRAAWIEASGHTRLEWLGPPND